MIKAQDDVKFLRWLEIVQPDEAKRKQTLKAVDWDLVLKVLIQIFQILLGLGCFGKARVTSRVKTVLATGFSPDSMVLALQQIRDDYAKK